MYNWWLRLGTLAPQRDDWRGCAPHEVDFCKPIGYGVVENLNRDTFRVLIVYKASPTEEPS